jgi:tetratricopeptide (TPR) repeat protein
VRKELVRPERATLPGDDAFRFRHILIRDAAYEALPKATRAALHERFADWLEQRAPDLVELDEIVGYHLEQATLYRLELGALTEADERTKLRAAERLQLAGERALGRHDAAGTRLLERGLSMVPPERRALGREWLLIRGLMDGGALGRALEWADELVAHGLASGDRRAELYGRLAREFVGFLGALPEEGAMATMSELAHEARAEFEAAGDDFGVAIAWFAEAHVHHNAMQWQKRHEALERSRRHAQLAHADHLHDEVVLWMAAGPVFGPMPTAEGLAWFDEEAQTSTVPLMLNMRAQVEAMVGNFEKADELMSAAITRMEELGHRLALASSGMAGSLIAMRSGDYEKAASVAVAGSEALDALGERGWLSTCAGYAAQALLRLDRDDEAEHWIEVADDVGGEDDVVTQMLIRQVRGKLASRRGRHEEAEKLVRAAVALVEQTDALEGRADAQIDLAFVLRAAGRGSEASEALAKAAALYERKGHLAGLAQTRELMAATAT